MNMPSSIPLVSAMVFVFLAIACASGRPIAAVEGTPDLGANSSGNSTSRPKNMMRPLLRRLMIGDC